MQEEKETYPAILTKKYKLIIAICLLLIITLISFYPSLTNDFTNWDDDLHVTANTSIKGLSLNNIKRMFTSFYAGNYMPLTILSYAVEYRLFTLNPHAYHTTNLLLHLFNCVLVFWLIYLLSGKELTGFIVALFFGIHPLHVESVAWISERKDVLYAFFFLSSLICYLLYLKKENAKKYYPFALLLFILSLFSKSMAVTLPLTLCVFDMFFHRPFNRKNLLEKVPFFALAVAFGVITLFSQSASIRHDISFFKSPFIASYGLVFYLTKLVLPINLSCMYPYPEGASYIPPWRLLGSGVIVILGILSILFLTKKMKYRDTLLFGCLFFFITILPVLQILPVGQAIAADRYTYIPLIGIFFIAGRGISYLYENKIQHSLTLKTFSSVLFAGIVIVLGILTWERCHVWRDSITLWSDVLQKYPNDPGAYNSRGSAFFLEKNYPMAIEDFNHAIRISPSHIYAHRNLCSIFSVTGKHEDAIAACKRAIEIKPDYADAHNLLGNIYHGIGKYGEAMTSYKRAIETNPNSEQAYNNLCITYETIGKHEEAITACKNAIEIKPDYEKAYNSLGNVYFSLGKYGEAISSYKKALEINPDFVSAHNNLAVSYYRTKHYNLSIHHLNRVIELGHKVHPEFLELLKQYRK
jgi:tetratricopeptide (TPR) repeat protein